MKYYLLTVVVVYLVQTSNGAMTEAQMKATAKMVRNVCQPKAKVSDELIDNVHKGIWVEDESLACFYKCVLATVKVAKNFEYLLDSALAQVQSIPEHRREGTAHVIKTCQNAGDGETNKCQYAYKIARCFYDTDPENYFLP